MLRRRPWIRYISAGDMLEAFLVSSVASILGIRFWLRLTNYPTIGGESLHVAHMLWGGLLMAAAILVFISYLGRSTAWFGAIAGGIGFGTFIDEVGKFLTHDNDYFYQPAVAIIYIVFIGIFVGGRRIHQTRRYTPDEYLINAICELEEMALLDLDEEERRRALSYLRKSDPANPLVRPLEELLVSATIVPPVNPSWLLRVKTYGHDLYQRTVRLPMFPTGIIAVFAVQLASKLSHLIAILFFFGAGKTDIVNFRFVGDEIQRLSELGFIRWVEVGSIALSSWFLLNGIARVRRSRILAYSWFKRSIMVSIFITQVFMFYWEQFFALLGLGINVLVLLALDYMIEQERNAQEASEVSEGS